MTYPDDENDAGAYDGDQSEPETRQVTLTREQIRSLERDAKQSRKAQDEAAKLRQELAFARSGHEFTEKQQKALLSVVDGDLTADSIKAAAAELGFVTSSAAEPEADADMAALDRVTAASAGTSSAPSADDTAKLFQADREGGKEAVLAELARKGVLLSNG